MSTASMSQRFLHLAFSLATWFVVVVPCVPAAPQGKPTPKDGSSDSTPSGGSIAGISYSSDRLPTHPAPPNPHERRVMLCYDMVAIPDSSVQPYILQPRAGKECVAINDANPFLDGDHLVVSVVPVSKFFNVLSINFNVTSQQASPLNPAPVRPVFSPSSNSPGAVAFDGGRARAELKSFFLDWPFPLRGDTIPSIAVTALVSPSPVTHVKGPPPAGPTPVPSPEPTPPPNPPDQLVALLNLTLPQIHRLYYYNVATGVVYGFSRNPSFTRVRTLLGTSPTNPSQYVTSKEQGDPTVAPVILFTMYFRGVDSESQWKLKELLPQGVSIGFSLTSPASSFFFGGSSEVRRNVQLVYGLSYAKVTVLAPTGVDDPTSSVAPTTEQKFRSGLFLGLTFNIDFIKSLFGGGGGGKASS